MLSIAVFVGNRVPILSDGDKQRTVSEVVSTH